MKCKPERHEELQRKSPEISFCPFCGVKLASTCGPKTHEIRAATGVHFCTTCAAPLNDEGRQILKARADAEKQKCLETNHLDVVMYSKDGNIICQRCGENLGSFEQLLGVGVTKQ